MTARVTGIAQYSRLKATVHVAWVFAHILCSFVNLLPVFIV